MSYEKSDGGFSEIDSLIESLHSQDLAEKLSALETLAYCGAKKALPHFIELLSDVDDNIRNKAAWAITETGFASNVEYPALVNLLSHNDSRIRTIALQCVLFLTKDSPLARSSCYPIASLLGDKYHQIRFLAAMSLKSIATEAIHSVCGNIGLTFERREEIIHSNTDVQRLRLFVLLSGSHPEGLTFLSQTVSHIDNSVRLASVVAIGRFQSPNVSMLLPLLSDRDEAIRRSIIVYLGELRDMRYSQYIIDRLKDDDAGVRYAATVALSSLKPDDSNSMDELTKALGDAEAKVRYGACLALARIAPQQESIRQAVFLTLNDVDPEVRQGAVRAIASIFPHSTLSLLKLVDVLNDTDIIVRWYAKQA